MTFYQSRPEGDEALTRPIRAARERGAIVVVVAHRPSGIEDVDMLLVLKEGRVQGVRTERPDSRTGDAASAVSADADQAGG